VQNLITIKGLKKLAAELNIATGTITRWIELNDIPINYEFDLLKLAGIKIDYSKYTFFKSVLYNLIKELTELELETFIKTLVKHVSYGGVTEFNYTKLKDNTFSTYTKNWGKFSLIKDTVPPAIKTTKSVEGKWISDKKSIEFTISDALSGIKTYDGYLNGNWVLFEYDYKTKKIVHYFDDGIVAEGPNNLKVVVTDNVGNSAIFETQFFRSQIKK
jgi:hypothetical protein